MDSPGGVIGYRRWLYSGDSKGNQFVQPDRLQVGYTIMPVRPTGPHALSYPDDGGREEAAEREGRFNRIVATLTETERTVLRLQGKIREKRLDVRRIPIGDLVEYTSGDAYTYHPGSDEIDGRGVVTVLVSAWVVEQLEPLNHVEIAKQLGITERQVRTTVERANRKMELAARRL